LHEANISLTNHPLCTGNSYRTKPKCLVTNPERWNGGTDYIPATSKCLGISR